MEDFLRNLVLFTNELPGFKIGLKLAIFYGSYLIFPFIIYLLFISESRNSIKLIFFILSIFFVHCRFIEPQLIIVKYEKIQTGFTSKFTLISDPHLGIFKGKNFLHRVVKKMHTLESDFTLIAWDFTYWTQDGELEDTFAPLKELRSPTYFVLGNHDVQKPGPKVRDLLVPILEKFWLTYIDNKTVKYGDINIIWLGDRWAWEDDVSVLKNYSKTDKIIVLTHNPDTTLDYPNDVADITFAGHTHGGQVRIPFLYKLVIPTAWNFDKWLYDTIKGKVYVSSGLWEVALAMRFLNPPEIIHVSTY